MEEFGSVLSDIFIAVASALVAIAAWYGLFTWRKELTGKAKLKTARNVVLQTYKVTEDFKWARFPPSSSPEAASPPKGTNESAGETQALDEWYLRSNRFEHLREDLYGVQLIALPRTRRLRSPYPALRFCVRSDRQLTS